MNYDEYNERCKSIGKSCSGLAEEAGVSRTTISRWKSGLNEPSAQSMFRLMRVLKKYEPTSELLTRTAKGIPDITTVSQPTGKTIVYAPDNAMIYDCIPKGAEITLISATPEEGDVVACIIDNKTVIRKYTSKENLVILSASNPKYFLITLTTDEFNEAFIGICDKVTFHVSHN